MIDIKYQYALFLTGIFISCPVVFHNATFHNATFHFIMPLFMTVAS